MQVLVQAREELIERTVESLGAQARHHPPLQQHLAAQRRVVFGQEKSDIMKVAVPARKRITGCRG